MMKYPVLKTRRCRNDEMGDAEANSLHFMMATKLNLFRRIQQNCGRFQLITIV